MDRDISNGLCSEYLRGLIRVYNLCGIKQERAWDLLYDVIFLDPVMTRNCSQIQPGWQTSRSRCSPSREWCVAFPSYMGQKFDKTLYLMKHWRFDIPRALGNQVDCLHLQARSSGKVKHTGEHFSWYGSDDPRAKLKLASCRQYKPGNCLAGRPLNRDEIIDDDNDDENWAEQEVSSG